MTASLVELSGGRDEKDRDAVAREESTANFRTKER